jgi:hypothetical protein
MDIVLLILFIFILLPLGYAGYVFAPWVPTRKKDAERIIELVKKYHHTNDGILYELGSGTGFISRQLAKSLNKKVVGIELVFPLFFYSFLLNFFSKTRAVFLWKDFFREDISNACLIYLFGTPKPLAGKLKEKFEKECKDGVIIISYVFEIPGWEPEYVSKPTEKDLSIYVYKMKPPETVRGRRAA